MRTRGVVVVTLVSQLLSTGCQGPKGDSSTDGETSGTTDSSTSGTSSDSPTSGTSTAAPTTGVDDCAEPVVVEGALVVDDKTDPATLECVVEVKGELHLDDTTTWVDLAPLARLERVGGNVTIHRNAALVSLDGLQKLEHVDGSVAVVENPLLADVSALSGLRQVAGLGLVENAVTVLDALQRCRRPRPRRGSTRRRCQRRRTPGPAATRAVLLAASARCRAEEVVWQPEPGVWT